VTTPTRYRFQPRLLTTLAAAAGIAVTLSLANWQLNRAHEKEALGARLERLAKDPPVSLGTAEIRAADVEWRRVVARGSFVPRHAVFIDNRIHRGVPGFHVVMPLEVGKMRSGGSRYVLVNRGWVAGTPGRSTAPQVKTPAGPVEIAGLAVIPSRRFLELSSEVQQGNIWQNLTLERYREAVPIALQPVLIRQLSPLDDGLVREWDPPDLGVDKHYGYAFQWLALAATLLVFYIVTHVRRAAPQEPR
jgi:surfeit locus 1 family protein